MKILEQCYIKLREIMDEIPRAKTYEEKVLLELERNKQRMILKYEMKKHDRITHSSHAV